MVYSAVEWDKLATGDDKSVTLTAQQRHFLLTLLEGFTWSGETQSIWIDRNQFDTATAHQANDFIEDLKYKIITAI